MVCAICPGSYDPFTFGHLDVICRAATLFDRVVVAIGQNTNKSGFLPLEVRLESIRQTISELDDRQLANKIEVAAYSGLVVDFAREVDADLLVKGLRGGADLDHEIPQARTNRQLAQIETLFLPTSARWGHVSSSLVRELVRFNAPVDDYVPAPVADCLSGWHAN